MRYLKIVTAILMIATLAVSCATFDYTKNTNVPETEVASGGEINSLEELMKESGVVPEETQEQPVENTAEASDENASSERVIDVNDAEKWTELEVPPAEEEIKSMEEAAVQPSEEAPSGLEVSGKQLTEQEMKKLFPDSNIDMGTLVPTHMDAVEPSLPGATWSSAEDLQIPEIKSEAPAETVEDDTANTETAVQETYQPSEIQWDDIEPQQQIPVTTLTEGASVAPEWDMLSEYDKFVAEFGGEIKEADSVSTSSFVVSEPEPIQNNPAVPEFVPPVQDTVEPPKTLDFVDENIQWETVQPEYVPIEDSIQPMVENTVEHPEDVVNPSGPANTETKNTGNIMSFFASIWNAISGFFLGIWNWIKGLIGKFFH